MAVSMLRKTLSGIAATFVLTMAAIPCHAQRKAMFEYLGTDSTQIVMLGNSLTAGAEWHELLHNPRVVNRGIIGDDTTDIMQRLKDVTDGHPAKIFLMAGANDISHNLSARRVTDNIAELIDSIRAQTPQTRLYVLSLLPVNNSFGRYKTMEGKEETIRAVNTLLSEECRERGLTFIDMHNDFCDANGNLNHDWTDDGLHLLLPAYLHWRDILLPFIDE